jgi:hypothetical protein
MIFRKFFFLLNFDIFLIILRLNQARVMMFTIHHGTFHTLGMVQQDKLMGILVLHHHLKGLAI